MHLRLVPTCWISPCSRTALLKTCRSSVAEGQPPYFKTFLAVLKHRPKLEASVFLKEWSHKVRD